MHGNVIVRFLTFHCCACVSVSVSGFHEEHLHCGAQEQLRQCCCELPQAAHSKNQMIFTTTVYGYLSYMWIYSVLAVDSSVTVGIYIHL